VTTTTEDLMKQFIEERQYCKNVTRSTIEYYWKVWRNWQPYLPVNCEDITKPALVKALKGLTDKGTLCPTSINIYLRGLNAFLKWLFIEGHLPKHIRLSLLKTEKKITQVFTEDAVRHIMAYKPKSQWAKRIQAMTVLIVDVGARINEVLTLTRSQVNLENRLVLLKGKGRKERLVPISPECRKFLYVWMRSHEHDLIFATKTGTQMSHTNSSRDFKKLCEAVGIKGVRCNWHTLRHTFATHYLRKGGDLLRLQASLGHSQLSMTQRYVHIATADLAAVHDGLSLVGTANR
jgi:integrase/recombinase XerD